MDIERTGTASLIVSRMTAQEMVDRLLLIKHDNSSWPAIKYDNYVQVLQHLSSRMSVKMKKEMFAAEILGHGQVPMAHVLGWDDEHGHVCLIPMTDENNQSFWNANFVDWCLHASSHRDDFDGKLGRAWNMLQDIIKKATESTKATGPASSSSSSANAVSPNESVALHPNAGANVGERQQQQQQHQPPPLQTNERAVANVVEEKTMKPNESQNEQTTGINNPASLSLENPSRVELPPPLIEPAKVDHKMDIGEHDDWEERVWPKMRVAGWKKRADGQGNSVYVKPGKMWTTGIVGQDFFDSLDGLKHWVVQQYGWKGLEDVSKKPAKKPRKSKQGERNVATPFLPKAQSQPVDSPSRVWGPDRKQVDSAPPAPSEKKAPSQPIMQKEQENERESGDNLHSTGTCSPDESDYSDGCGSQELKFPFLWPKLQQQGWDCIAARNNLEYWWYVLPGHDAKNGQRGVDYFNSEQDVVEYYRRCQGLTQTTANGKRAQSGTVASPSKRMRSSMTPEQEIAGKPQVQSVEALDCHRNFKEIESDNFDWWRRELPPIFRDVWPLLQKLHFRFGSGCYVVPNAPRGDMGRFPIDFDLQKFLCSNGIPDYEETECNLTEEEKVILHRWISMAFVPNSQSIDLRRIKMLKEHEAWKMLAKLGWSRRDGKFFHGPRSFDTMDELRCYVRSLESIEIKPTGRKQARASKAILDDKQTLELRLWAASSHMPLPKFEIPVSWVLSSTKTKVGRPSSRASIEDKAEEANVASPMPASREESAVCPPNNAESAVPIECPSPSGAEVTTFAFLTQDHDSSKGDFLNDEDEDDDNNRGLAQMRLGEAECHACR